MYDNEKQIKELVEQGALFAVNHSGGKDSQAMLITVRKYVPREQLIIVHAVLPDVEWDGTTEKVEEYADGIPVIHARARKADGTGRTLFNMVEDRAEKIAAKGGDASPWPSPKYRQCTSDLKRNPINREIRRWAKENGFADKHIVSCEGMRAEESPNRAKAKEFHKVDNLCTKARDWFKWLPIHAMLVGEVFETIRNAGQEPHWAYAAGMTRLSCCFCIMSSMGDLRTAKRLNPSLFSKYVELERKVGKSMLMPKKGSAPQNLDEIVK